jgi:hypothetical protein
MQRLRGVDKAYRIKAEAVVTAHDATLKASGKLRALIAVFALGTILMFITLSFLDALSALRAERAQRRLEHDDGPSFLPPLTLAGDSDSFDDPDPEVSQWPLKAER